MLIIWYLYIFITQHDPEDSDHQQKMNESSDWNVATLRPSRGGQGGAVLLHSGGALGQGGDVFGIYYSQYDYLDIHIYIYMWVYIYNDH